MAEKNPDLTREITGQTASPDIEFYGGRLVSILPIVVFILWAILQTAFWYISDTTGLIVGMLIGLIVGLFFVKGSWTGYANTIFEGMTQPVAVTAIVAWMWAGMFSETLQVGGFVDGLVWAASALNVGALMFPAVTFILCALLTTGIGTGYGATIAFVTLFFPAGVLLGADPVLLFGAILSGAVFGDNLAPVSDTTIVSAVTQDADIGGVVASRFKYAIIAAVVALPLYVVVASTLSGLDIPGDPTAIIGEQSDPVGLVHLLSMAAVIGTAIAGRHIVEAISWVIITDVVVNLVFGLSSAADLLVFRAPASAPLAEPLSGLPILEVVAASGNVGVGGSLYNGVVGFLPLSILVLFIVAGAQIMIRGGAFEAILEFTFNRLATTVRRAELTMVGSAALINAAITINTAAEIAIGPFISKVGEKFNLNSYRRANILDSQTAALGYIFPWSGGVLAGFGAMRSLPNQYEWFTPEMVVNPIEVVPFVFQGWLLVAVFIVAAITGFGREYITDRTSEEVARA